MKNCFNAFGCSFMVDSDTAMASVVWPVPHHPVKTWHGSCMLTDYPYSAWGYLRDSEVVICDFAAQLERVINDTREMGEETAEFLRACSDIVVELRPDPEFFGSPVQGGVRVIVNFSYLYAGEETDAQCYSIVTVTEDVFEDVFGQYHVIFN
jgi:hypothetical protein